VKNGLAGATSVVATSPATGFAEALLSDLFVGLPFKYGTVAAGDVIAIEFSSPKKPVLVAVHNPNFESDVDVRYQVASNGSFSADVETFASFVVPPREPNIPAADGGLFPDFYSTGTSVTAQRFHRFRIFGAGSQSDQWKIGQLVVCIDGDLISLPKSFVWGLAGGERPAVTILETQAGGVWATFTREARQEFSLSWRGLSETRRREIRDVFRRTFGPALPFTIAPFPSVNVNVEKRTEAYYARFRSDFAYVDTFENDKSVNGVLVREEAREFVG
jgi:hypothetical protein